MTSIHSQLDHFSKEDGEYEDEPVELEQSFETYTDLTPTRYVLKQSHWKDSAKAVRCSNESCAKDFRFVLKKMNCRRCGEVFCEQCCQYRKLLNCDALPHPAGSVHRVCWECSDLHQQPIGQIRNLTKQFIETRKSKRLVLSTELNRLIAGFEENANLSSVMKFTIKSLEVLKIPVWQKSLKWIESAQVDCCSICDFRFLFVSRKYNCRLCGYVYCDKCCDQNLLLYFNEQHMAEAKLIGVVGCPDTEPRISMYLSICSLCQDDLEEYQVQQYHNKNNGNENNGEKIQKLQVILDKLSNIQKKIDDLLPMLNDQLETYLYEECPEHDAYGNSNMESFAKAHADMNDTFAKYAIVLQGLKDIHFSSSSELKMLRNIVSVKCGRYSMGVHTYKNLRSKMEECIPAKYLKKFQIFANMQAINYTYLTARQLGLELLNLCLKYNLGTELAEKMSNLDHVCYTDLEMYINNIGEDKEQHMNALKQLIKEKMKDKTLISVLNKPHVQAGEQIRELLVKRCFDILNRILKQLNAKSSETEFSNSKNQLQEVIAFVEFLKRKDDQLASDILEYDIVEIS